MFPVCIFSSARKLVVLQLPVNFASGSLVAGKTPMFEAVKNKTSFVPLNIIAPFEAKLSTWSWTILCAHHLCEDSCPCAISCTFSLVDLRDVSKLKIPVLLRGPSASVMNPGATGISGCRHDPDVKSPLGGRVRRLLIFQCFYTN